MRDREKRIDSKQSRQELSNRRRDLPKEVESRKINKYEDKIKKMQERQAVIRNKRSLPKKMHPKVIASRQQRRASGVSSSSPSSIFITGGVGDVLAIESYFSEAMRANLETIYYATHKHHLIKQLFESLPNYPKLRRHVVVWDDFSSFWCFLFKSECMTQIQARRLPVDSSFEQSPDYGIIPTFARINGGKMSHTYSSFASHRLCSIQHFALPQTYVAICPYSSDKRVPGRDFDDHDWQRTIDYLKSLRLRGVVLNSGQDKVPDDDTLINLSNKTSICECVEVVKNASGYVGIDSSMSVIATKIFHSNNIFVKSQNSHLFTYKHIYYAPQSDFSFIGTTDEKLEGQRLTNLNNIREINIETVQGLGDIFWVYQKLAPHFDRINLNILITDDGEIQKRSADWVKLFPKVGDVRFKLVEPGVYMGIGKHKFPMTRVMSNWKRGLHMIPYAVNKYLEDGVRIDEIDPDFSVETDVEIATEEVDIPYDNYACLYVSGATKQLDPKKLGAWDVEMWLDMVSRFYHKYGIRPTAIIGATFDREVVDEIAARLKDQGVPVITFVQYKPSQVCYILKNAEVFIGFQSGLNIIADNLGIKQVMLYYNMLSPMLYTWCKREHIKTKFHAFTFSTQPAEVVNALPDDFITKEEK